MVRRGLNGDSEGRAHSFSLAEKMPRWSVTLTWPASMAARLCDASCCGPGAGSFGAGSLASTARRCGGDTEAFKLASAGTFVSVPNAADAVRN